MKWSKKGLVYSPGGDLWWARSHALLPTADISDPLVIRVYFAALDEQQYGRIGYVDLDAEDPKKILRETREPILDLGELGAFDDSGVTPSCLLRVSGKNLLYYIGWQRCVRVPYMLFAGLAIGDERGNTFTKSSSVPLLDRTSDEPFSRGAPFVLCEGGRFKMWYWSCERWSNEDGWVHYNNVIRYLESVDGLSWQGSGAACLSPEGRDYSVGRPWVLKDADTYRMWYSVRGKDRVSYRIGYAESNDGLVWTKRDADVGIDVSTDGWDSEMICHPSIVDVRGSRLMFYNGNGNGSTGFGYAVLE